MPEAPKLKRQLPPRPPSWWSTIKVWARDWHRDLGALAVGLTFVYALSGLALNHIEDFKHGSADYINIEESMIFNDVSSTMTPLEVAEVVLPVFDRDVPDELNTPGNPSAIVDTTFDDVIFSGADGWQIQLSLKTGEAKHTYQKPRVLLHSMNWLHRARGKAAWDWFADGYAIVLLLLATSGLILMPKGRRGLKGRAGILVLIGIAIPVLFVLFSGGSSGEHSQNESEESSEVAR